MAHCFSVDVLMLSIALICDDWTPESSLMSKVFRTNRFIATIEKDDKNILETFFIGPESDHWQPLSVTHSLTNSLTHSRLVHLIDMTLACEDANSKLVEVVTIANVDHKDRVGNSLLHT